MFDEPTRTHTFAWIAAALVLIAVGYRVLGNRQPTPPPVAIDEPAAADAAPGGESGGAGRGERLYVHVAGAVRRPGLYGLRDGARVAAALERAGGPKPRANLAAINLAARVQDGQQVLVPVRGRAAAVGVATGGAAPAGATSGAGAVPGAPISLASATQAQLEELDGIGPALASRIIEYRDAHGGFRSADELGEVDGIGDVRLEALRRSVQP